MGGNTLKTYMMLRSGDDDRRDGDRIDNRFRDRSGREHYNDGRFAPMRSEYETPHMGYYEPVRMGEDDDDYRRKWTITEANDSRHMEPQREEVYNMGGMRRVMGFGGSSYVDHSRMDEMSHRSGEKMPGHASVRSAPVLTWDMAKEWMDKLQNADGSKGAHWTFDEVKNLMQTRGVQGDPLVVWVAMNAEYSDSVMLNRKYGVDRPEYYLDAAVIRWLNDKDAVADKAAAYYMHIVKH